MAELSSEPSSQSGSPSQCQRLGTHWPLVHTKSTSAQVSFSERGRETALVVPGGLVAAICTVLVSITPPDGRDAAAVPTLELVGLTLWGGP
ncbi:hypothetical protein NHX12_027912 [Muraenolepis orangiensis]|uniref:Uncharacterized protein n=1 Tax=Muraenolepis orangiensis TaxID=630683 RepID=A0A9Q0EEJ3_9TELE|nr:hypothetical protein NHX12_027912 [Muraenolepis orangiensis]